MEMKIRLDLSIGDEKNKKDISLTYDEAKELYNKLGELFNKESTGTNLHKILDKYKVTYYNPYRTNTWCTF